MYIKVVGYDRGGLFFVNSRSYHDGAVVRASCIRFTTHEAPVRDCACGIYSARAKGPALWHTLTYLSPVRRIIALIPHGRAFDDGEVVRSEYVTVIGELDVLSVIPPAVRRRIEKYLNPRDRVPGLARDLRQLREGVRARDPGFVLLVLDSARATLGMPPIDRERRKRIVRKLAFVFGNPDLQNALRDLRTAVMERHAWGIINALSTARAILGQSASTYGRINRIRRKYHPAWSKKWERPDHQESC